MLKCTATAKTPVNGFFFLNRTSYSFQMQWESIRVLNNLAVNLEA